MLKEIVGRYALVIREIGKKADQGQIVGDLIRVQVRKCLIEMHAAGAEAADIRAIFDNLEKHPLEDCTSADHRFSKLLTTMKLHVEFLLFIEDHELAPSSPKKGNSSFGFH
ncbi:hypothetical protein HFRIS_014829 [Herbaspirillum frisingense GSF30]|uniref:Uncharacterized protein n=2 Tax=Oxalobacteraceae TaxID=75682 RepID=A0AAI9ID68_9BURK|nr:hypothetical protein HFRIS_014829 [Herbaspirillum frisingense GSF30]